MSCCLAIMKYNDYISIKLNNFVNGEIILIVYAKLNTTVNIYNTVKLKKIVFLSFVETKRGSWKFIKLNK